MQSTASASGRELMDINLVVCVTETDRESLRLKAKQKRTTVSSIVRTCLIENGLIDP